MCTSYHIPWWYTEDKLRNLGGGTLSSYHWWLMWHFSEAKEVFHALLTIRGKIRDG